MKMRLLMLLLTLLLALLMAATGFCVAETTEPLPEGVVPVTWDVSADHLMIEGEEARALYERIVSGDYPSMEELRANPVVAQLDALSAYYKALYGNTAEIDTPEHNALRGFSPWAPLVRITWTKADIRCTSTTGP